MTFPQPPIIHPERAAAPRNGVGTAGFVLGLLGFLFSFIPIVGLIAWPLVLLGLVLALIGLSNATKGRATNKGLAVAGIVLSALGLLVCIAWVAFLGKAATDEANKSQVVVYEVSGDAKTATVTYSTFSDGGSATSQEELSTLPWRKELTVKGLLSGGTLTVTAGADGGSVACKITIDGVEKKSATGTGAFTSALCSGF